LHIRIRGKEDISRHRQSLQTQSSELHSLRKRFDAENDARFLELAQERTDLSAALDKIRSALKLKLGTSSLPALRGELRALEQAQTENNMTLQDKERCAGKILSTARNIEMQLSVWRDGKIRQATEAVREKAARRPTEADQELLRKNLAFFRKKAAQSAAAFKDADEAQREPSKALFDDNKTALRHKRQDATRRAAALTEVEKELADLGGQLKQAGIHRPVAIIDAELQDADAAFHREQVLQQARQLLIGRIGKKIDDMTAEVPVELGRCVTEHLSRLTRGWLDRVQLDAKLRVQGISENGVLAASWRPSRLSHGERHQAALAVKIAVARALAQTHGPIFIMLDDSLVTFDPARRASTEELLLDLVADGLLQVILFTCHTDWAAGWKQRRPDAVNYIDLPKVAQYYRQRSSVVTV
jgi:DNA repair exonuclease SbcCD ATPase subunit